MVNTVLSIAIVQIEAVYVRKALAIWYMATCRSQPKEQAVRVKLSLPGRAPTR